MNLDPVDRFKFCRPFQIEDSFNGLCLGNHYIPEEIIVLILSYQEPKKLLHLSLVCKKWSNIIKSDSFWMYLYNKICFKKAKQLPWYVYYLYFTTNTFHNLLKNTSGERQFHYWKIKYNGGDKFKVESIPEGADPLPYDIKDFNGRTSCFATSYGLSKKIQNIPLKHKRLLRYVMKQHKPHIYVSEWMAGRFDCGCRYQLGILGFGKNYDREIEATTRMLSYTVKPLFHKTKEETVEQWQGRAWKKVEILVDKYPENVLTLVFEHEGQDTQFWKGHFGSKMAGGVLKFVFDSIEPVDDNER